MTDDGIRVDADGCEADNLCYSGAVSVSVAPAFPWRTLVSRAVAEGWVGVEALGGFAGSVADAVAANYSAFGQQAGDAVWSIKALDNGRLRTFAAADCGFADGSSRFAATDIVGVELVLRAGTITAPLTADLAALASAPKGSRCRWPRSLKPSREWRKWKKAPRDAGPSTAGALGGTPNPNLLIRSQLLYPLSHERLGEK